MVRARATTSAQSAICGSTFGETNEPTSISRRPACASAAIQRCLASVGSVRLMLCSPSRGPTSLISHVHEQAPSLFGHVNMYAKRLSRRRYRLANHLS